MSPRTETFMHGDNDRMDVDGIEPNYWGEIQTEAGEGVVYTENNQHDVEEEADHNEENEEEAENNEGAGVEDEDDQADFEHLHDEHSYDGDNKLKANIHDAAAYDADNQLQEESDNQLVEQVCLEVDNTVNTNQTISPIKDETNVELDAFEHWEYTDEDIEMGEVDPNFEMGDINPNFEMGDIDPDCPMDSDTEDIDN